MAEMAREMRTLAVRNDGAGVEEDATRHFFETRLRLSTHVVLRRLPNVAKICLRLIFLHPLVLCVLRTSSRDLALWLR